MDKILDQTLNWGGDSDPHALTLYSLAVSLGAKNILELGVRGGNSTLPLLAAANVNGGILTSVDIDQSSKDSADNLVDKYFTNKEKLVWTFYVEEALKFLNRECSCATCYDLVYVDDWHSYDHVKAEFELLDRMVSPSSLILVHDTMYANYQPHYHTDLAVRDGQWANGGPYRAIAELDPNFWEFSTIPVSHGLTIVRKKYSGLYNV